MLQFVILAVVIVGINTILWTTVGIMRLIAESTQRADAVPEGPFPSPSDVAILMAAHNEETVIGDSIRSLRAISAGATVFVVSDGSTDATADIARGEGAEVLELSPNRGKAGALVEALTTFDIASKFEVVLLLDADTHLTPGYLESGLPQFADPGVVAVAGRAATMTSAQPLSLLGRVLIGYRNRVYIAMQYLLKFGQAARHANAVAIVPGFASMYRTRVLDSIDINASGLVIEDYNMTFEVHANRLGRIAFHPGAAVALTQDPDTFAAYAKQVGRWNLGFWQTVRRHRFQFRVFWFALSLFIVELVVSSVVLLLLVPVLAVSLMATLVTVVGLDSSGTAEAITVALPPLALALAVFIPDYLLTIFAAIVAREPRYLVMGFVFPILRVIDAFLCMKSLFEGFLVRSTGMWKSPPRRVVTVAVPVSDGARG